MYVRKPQKKPNSPFRCMWFEVRRLASELRCVDLWYPGKCGDTTNDVLVRHAVRTPHSYNRSSAQPNLPQRTLSGLCTEMPPVTAYPRRPAETVLRLAPVGRARCNRLPNDSFLTSASASKATVTVLGSPVSMGTPTDRTAQRASSETPSFTGNNVTTLSSFGCCPRSQAAARQLTNLTRGFLQTMAFLSRGNPSVRYIKRRGRARMPLMFFSGDRLIPVCLPRLPVSEQVQYHGIFHPRGLRAFRRAYRAVAGDAIPYVQEVPIVDADGAGRARQHLGVSHAHFLE